MFLVRFPTAAESTKSFFSKCSCFDSQDGPYGQLLDVSQHVFTCDSAKVQRSPKTPPPLVPPRTFIRGSFFENRPSKTVSLPKQTNQQTKPNIYSIYIIYIIYYIYCILYIIYYMLYNRRKEKTSLLDLDYSHGRCLRARTPSSFFSSAPGPCFQHFFLWYKLRPELGCFRRRTFEGI